MSCQGFTIGDIGAPIHIAISICGSKTIDSPIVSADIIFTGPDGTSFEREATVESERQIRYVTVADDFTTPGFTVPGTWTARPVAVVTEDGRTRKAICGAKFTVWE